MSELDVAEAPDSEAWIGEPPAAIRLYRRFTRIQRRVPIVQIILLLATYGYGVSAIPGFDSGNAIRSILVIASIAGLASTGQTLLILLGGFDLAVPGFIVGGALFVTQVRLQLHWSFGVALVVALIGAGILGGISGQLCHRFRAQPLIVTLAMGSIATGIVVLQTTAGSGFTGSSPLWLSHFTSPGATTFGIGIPPTVSVWLVVGVLMGFLVHRTVIGRHILATGANERAADYSLIKTRLVWTGAFAFSAMASVLVGLLVAGFSGSIALTSGDPYLFDSVVSVIIGGTIFGGPGDYWRTMVGALFLSVVDIVLVGKGASSADQQIFYGVAILVAVSLYSRERSLRDQV